MASDATHFQPEDGFAFTLLLFGWANEYLPYFVYTLEEMGKIGLGRSIAGQRGSFRLEQITAQGQLIYHRQDRVLLKQPPQDLALPEPGRHREGTSTITVRLETPRRLKYQNTLQAQLPFHVLLRAVLRRIASLGTSFEAGEPRLDYRGLVGRAQQVETVQADLQWLDWRRYSNRQDQAMLMGGLTGSVTYEGNLAELQPLFAFAEQVHIGKATTFGLGKIRVVSETA